MPSESIVAVACTSMWSVTVAVDEHGNPLMPAIFWMDTRGGKYNRQIVRGSARDRGLQPVQAATLYQRRGRAADAFRRRCPRPHALHPTRTARHLSANLQVPGADGLRQSASDRPGGCHAEHTLPHDPGRQPEPGSHLLRCLGGAQLRPRSRQASRAHSRQRSGRTPAARRRRRTRPLTPNRRDCRSTRQSHLGHRQRRRARLRCRRRDGYVGHAVLPRPVQEDGSQQHDHHHAQPAARTPPDLRRPGQQR